jgi:alkylated DNA repair dioxygenase AlkB
MLPDIPGLQYVPDYLDRATHDSLLTAADLDPWLMSVDHGVRIYGYRYSRANRAAFRIGKLPPCVGELAVRLCRDGFLPKVPDQMVANDYPPGSGIFAHVDPAVFGDVVASVSLGSTCIMRFSHRESDRSEELLLEPRSVLVLSGDARWAWQHEIPARVVDTWQGTEVPRSRRVSLTFRVMPAGLARHEVTCDTGRCRGERT